MNVRIRIPRGRPLKHHSGKNRQVAMAFGALLAPASLMAYALGVWSFASDMGVAGEFGFSGILSHWQLWIGLGISLHLASATLNRYGKGGELVPPRLLTSLPWRTIDTDQEQKRA